MSDWEDWLGRRTVSTIRFDVEHVNRMAVTLDRTPHFNVGDVLPPAWHWLYFHDFVKASDLGDEGHPRLGLIMPPMPLPRRMWAGGMIKFRAPIYVGDTLEKSSTIRSITPKQGRTGLLYFVTVEHTLGAQGEIKLFEEQSIVYREMSTGEAVAQARPAPTDADFSYEYALNSTALFRYSALTFNGHRIHYDLDYCRDIEGYPNLVVHGPLIATLLLDLYVQQGLPLTIFRYQARSPLFLPQPFRVHGKRDGQSTKLWASNHAGGLAMDAEVSSQ